MYTCATHRELGLQGRLIATDVFHSLVVANDMRPADVVTLFLTSEMYITTDEAELILKRLRSSVNSLVRCSDFLTFLTSTTRGYIDARVYEYVILMKGWLRKTNTSELMLHVCNKRKISGDTYHGYADVCDLYVLLTSVVTACATSAIDSFTNVTSLCYEDIVKLALVMLPTRNNLLIKETDFSSFRYVFFCYYHSIYAYTYDESFLIIICTHLSSLATAIQSAVAPVKS